MLVLLDSDSRDCKYFLSELKSVLDQCRTPPNTMFRLAIEEIEAWYIGDRRAVIAACPRAKKAIWARYQQDSVCGTWELLADAVYPGGAQAIRKAGWPLPGTVKHEWAEKIRPCMDITNNLSPSFLQISRWHQAIGRQQLTRPERRVSPRISADSGYISAVSVSAVFWRCPHSPESALSNVAVSVSGAVTSRQICPCSPASRRTARHREAKRRPRFGFGRFDLAVTRLGSGHE